MLLIVLAAAVLRIAQWPAFHEVRDGDELGYSWGSLQLLEGNLPGMHYAPAGPQTCLAYERKFKSGMDRFHLNESEIPRALSEVNLALERANRRCFFILGGTQDISEPRYDTRVFESGPLFGIRKVETVFNETGGVVVLRSSASDPIVQALGTPIVSWVSPSGDGTRIYCSPDVVMSLR